MVAPLTPQMSATRQAIRFLINQKAGLLFSIGDDDSDEPIVTRVFYTLDQDGALLAYLPRNSVHAKAIKEGATSTLTVEAPDRFVPDWLTPEIDDPTELISHVQADVHGEVIDDPVQIAEHMIEWLESQGRADLDASKDEVIQIILDQVVALRLHVDILHVYHRVPMYEVQALAG